MDNANEASKKNKSLRIAYVIENFPSPTEYFILNEILALEKQQVTIFVLAIRKTVSNINPNLSSLKAPIYYSQVFSVFLLFLKLMKCYKKLPILFDKDYFSFKNLLKQLKYLALSIDFERQIKKSNITHVHAHFAFVATDVGYLLSKLLNVNFSFTAHAQDIYLNKSQLVKKIKNASCVFTCTKQNERYIKQLTKHKYDDKVYHIYHGIDVNGFIIREKTNQKDPGTKVLCVARLVEKKGIIYLLKAIKILTDRQIKLICKIIGDGHLRSELECFVDKAGIRAHVFFSGMKSRSEVLKEMSDADVFVLPCIVAANGDMDGLPNVLIEAMLMGVPVITTNVSGIPELIKNGQTGILVPEKDENAIANSILNFINDNELYRSIAIGARNKVINDFNISESTNQLIALFKKYAKD